MAPTKTLIVTLAIAMYEVGTFCKPDWILAAPRPGRFRVLAQFGWVPARTQKKVQSASVGLLQQNQCSPFQTTANNVKPTALADDHFSHLSFSG